ncbi:hypothetical protein NC652_041452 [Populus alba x Populus x berolinensis]|nr:hypothetical protein NC652_041452 [Populus alba x Populus x berolinensis]
MEQVSSRVKSRSDPEIPGKFRPERSGRNQCVPFRVNAARVKDSSKPLTSRPKKKPISAQSTKKRRSRPLQPGKELSKRLIILKSQPPRQEDYHTEDRTRRFIKPRWPSAPFPAELRFAVNEVDNSALVVLS